MRIDVKKKHSNERYRQIETLNEDTEFLIMKHFYIGRQYFFFIYININIYRADIKRPEMEMAVTVSSLKFGKCLWAGIRDIQHIGIRHG